ncbi:MAG: 4Fe-4S binding protein [Candidatus Hodarchaeota archaeon]
MRVENISRTGVFVCRCGGNIGDVVDVEALCEDVKNWEGVAVVRYNDYLCSKPGQDMIINQIKRRELNKVIIASCTPRMHLATFQDMLKRAGLNPYSLEFVNIREHCSWVHGPHKSEEATDKALSLTRGGYERIFKIELLEQIKEKSSRDVLVIGGGIAGIAASLELENIGHKVYLLDRYPSIGGHMAKLTKVFPTIDCAQCILTPRMAEVERRKNLSLLTYAEVKDVEGRPGNYKVTVFMKPRGVEIEKCMGCGVCAKVCPVKCADEFNEYRSQRKAAYLPFPQAVPYAYVIDFDHCTECGKCAEVCPSKAINLEDSGRTLELEVGSIIMATGYEQFNAEEIENYGYGVYPDVITMMELERLTSLFGPTGGNMKRFSDGKSVSRLAIVLCAGSRDTNRYTPYCSRICCMYSLKQAVLLKELLNIDVHIFYTDIRATGRGYEELYWRAQKAGVVFIRGKVAEVWANRKGNKLVVRAEDTLTGDLLEEEFDMVSLAVSMVPPSGLNELAQLMSLPLGEDGFVQEKHPKLDPVDTLSTGIFACGCALGPKDVRDTVSDALASASKVASFLNKEYVVTNPEKAFVNPDLCDGCHICLEICPSNAITLTVGKASISPFLCIGCGACIPECPGEAINLKNATKEQIISTLKGILHGKKPGEVLLIAFTEKTIAYTGLDLLGIDRAAYPANIRIIAVPSTAILGPKDLLYAFALGADGIILLEGLHDMDERYMKKRIEKFEASLEEMEIESERLWYSLVELPAYRKIAAIFTEHTDLIQEFGPLPDDIRIKIRQKLELEYPYVPIVSIHSKSGL